MRGDFWTLIVRIAVVSYVFASLAAALIVLRLIWRWLKGRNPNED
jgi:hypothetical protein